MPNKNLIEAINNFIYSYETEADKGWPKSIDGQLARSKYDVRNKNLKLLWTNLVEKIESKCEISNNSAPYKITPAKGSVFPSPDSGRVILYFYHSDAYKDLKISAKRGLYCALFFNFDVSHDYKFKLALTQGREDLEEKEGDKLQAKSILRNKAIEIAKIYSKSLNNAGFTIVSETEKQSIEIAMKEYNQDTAEQEVINDIKNLLTIYANCSIGALSEFDLIPEDINPPDRTDVTVSRIIRDTKLSSTIKLINSYECQLCGLALDMPEGKKYAEAHHLQPLGEPHNGSDTAENMICVCPNHHAQLDYGAISLDLSKITMKLGHSISEQYIKYHNDSVYKA